jgi:hypothetical protein
LKLPFADEIREARAVAEEAARAMVDVARVEAAVASVGVYEHQLRLRPELPLDPFPGDQLVHELAERWPALADLASAIPRSSESSLSRLNGRRDQLEAARRELRPIAAEAEARGLRLHGLQHSQRHALESPRWNETVAELGLLGADRERLAGELRPLEQRLSALRPIRSVLTPLAQRVRGELANRSGEDPHGFTAWRSGHVARAILESLARIMAPVALELPLPPPPAVTDRPDADPEVREAIWWDVEGIADRLKELSDALDLEADALERRCGILAAQAEEIRSRILERTG